MYEHVWRKPSVAASRLCEARCLRRKTLQTILKRAKGASAFSAQSILIISALKNSKTCRTQDVFVIGCSGWLCSLLWTARAARSTWRRARWSTAATTGSAAANIDASSGFFDKMARIRASRCIIAPAFNERRFSMIRRRRSATTAFRRTMVRFKLSSSDIPKHRSKLTFVNSCQEIT